MPTKIESSNFDNIVKAYLSGVSENQLAKINNVSRSVIHRILLKKGIKRRGRSEAELLKWSQMPKEKRKHQFKAAHEAARNRARSMGEMSKSAKTKQKTLSKVGKGEKYILNWFREKGFDAIPQRAFNQYNIDIAIGDSVAVELMRYTASPFRRESDSRKIKNLTNLGWNVIYVWVTRGDILVERTIEQIIPIIKRTYSDPTFRGKYWVIRGTGEVYTTSCSDSD